MAFLHWFENNFHMLASSLSGCHNSSIIKQHVFLLAYQNTFYLTAKFGLIQVFLLTSQQTGKRRCRTLIQTCILPWEWGTEARSALRVWLPRSHRCTHGSLTEFTLKWSHCSLLFYKSCLGSTEKQIVWPLLFWRWNVVSIYFGIY